MIWKSLYDENSKIEVGSISAGQGEITKDDSKYLFDAYLGARHIIEEKETI